MNKSRAMVLSAALCGALLCGCSLNRTAARMTGEVMRQGMPAYLDDGDVQTGCETMPGAIKLVEAVLRSDPGNGAMLELAAQGNCGYAYMFAEDENPARASLLYARGARFSRQALEADGVFSSDGDFVRAKARASAVPAMFWNAFCRAGYAQLNLDSTDAMADIHKVEDILSAVLELDPGYYYGTAHTLLGALEAVRPPLLGGNPEKARQHFEAATGGAGASFLSGKLMYAKAYAVRVQDRALFERLLSEIENAGDPLPEQRLANAVAKEKAKKLMENADDYF